MIRTIRFVQGEEVDLVLPVTDKYTGLAVCLETFEGATAYFPPATGTTPVSVIGVVYDADQGLVRFNVTEAKSLEVLSGDEQDFEYVVDRSSAKRIVTQVFGKLFVNARLFST